jgi:folate-binding protein YgfZ
MTTVLHDNLATAEDLGGERAGFRALVTGCGVYELTSRVKLTLAGKDRVRWLNGMITNNIRDLAAGQGVYAFLLNPQGHILGDLYAYNREESLLLDVDQGQTGKLLATLRRYIIMDKVELADAGGQLTSLGVSGPRAAEVLRATGIELPDLAPLQFVDLVWRDVPLTAVRSDNPGVASFELWLAAEHAASVQQKLIQAGAMPVGAAAVELLRIACGIPRYGQDIRERDLPQETEQLRALNFSKGCYIGQEIVERIRARGAVHRKFTGFLVDGDLPPAGAKIQADGKDVGEVTSVACLPLAGGERRVALGYLRKEAAQPGKVLQSTSTNLSVATLPFEEVFKN